MTMRFVTSSFCLDGGCVGIAAEEGTTSSFCHVGGCVEVYDSGVGFMAIGDNKLEDPQASALELDTVSYELFRLTVMTGQFDHERLSGYPVISNSYALVPVFVQLEPERGRYPIGLGIRCGCPDNTEAKLFFDRDEWDAFVNGIKNGEMTPELLRSADAKV